MNKKLYAEMVRRARDEMPRRLDYDDEAPWTQSAMAALVGVEPNYWAMVERGEREPSRMFQRCLDYAMQMASAGLDPRAPSVW